MPEVAGFLSDLAFKGTGWTLFVIAVYFYIRKDAKLEERVERHLQDMKDAGEKYQKSAEIMTANNATALDKANVIATASNQISQSNNQVLQNLQQILQNLQQSSTIRKQ